VELNSSTIWGCVGYASQCDRVFGQLKRTNRQPSCVAHMESGSIVHDVVYLERME
jgi:hypothetical protein